MKFELTPYNRNVPDEDFLNDLRRVSFELKKESLSQGEYEEFGGKYHPNTISRRFGSWNKALILAGLQIRQSKVISNEEFFENLEEIWTKLGRQPKREECLKPFSKYSSSAYERRFGSWLKALEAFVKFINEEEHDVLAEEINVIPTD